MSISIILADGTIIPEETLSVLLTIPPSVTITRVAEGQPACPYCGDASHVRGTDDPGRLECWRCWRDCFLVQVDTSVYMTRSHPWRGQPAPE